MACATLQLQTKTPLSTSYNLYPPSACNVVELQHGNFNLVSHYVHIFVSFKFVDYRKKISVIMSKLDLFRNLWVPLICGFSFHLQRRRLWRLLSPPTSNRDYIVFIVSCYKWGSNVSVFKMSKKTDFKILFLSICYGKYKR